MCVWVWVKLWKKNEWKNRMVGWLVGHGTIRYDTTRYGMVRYALTVEHHIQYLCIHIRMWTDKQVGPQVRGMFWLGFSFFLFRLALLAQQLGVHTYLLGFLCVYSTPPFFDIALHHINGWWHSPSQSVSLTIQSGCLFCYMFVADVAFWCYSGIPTAIERRCCPPLSRIYLRH